MHIWKLAAGLALGLTLAQSPALAQKSVIKFGWTSSTGETDPYAVGAREAWRLEAAQQAYLYVLDDQKVQVPTEDIDPDWISETVFEVAAGILGQGFEPQPSYSACSMCDYRIACPAAER